MAYVSVIIPSYNSQETIEQCLVSVRQSTYKDYELIVVDDASSDDSCPIASKYADMVMRLTEHLGRSQARNRGIMASAGQIIVNIDSDVVIRPDTIARIADYFIKHPDVSAVNGLLSKEHPHPGFFSQYKNLYMHYIFNKLPEKVTFLYGSIHAFRREDALLYGCDDMTADDTALGQKLLAWGKQIGFIKTLEVVHLKRYNWFSFIKNDFQIPFDWGKIFLKYQGWKQLGRNKTGFAHSPKEQLISTLLAPVIILSGILSLSGNLNYLVVLFLTVGWLLLNVNFLAFLIKERGFLFGVLAFFVTFLDNIVMACGIVCGFTAFLLRKKICKNQ
jgi:glycosyltransferase involved in cell wall biosynthesis